MTHKTMDTEKSEKIKFKVTETLVALSVDFNQHFLVAANWQVMFLIFCSNSEFFTS